MKRSSGNKMSLFFSFRRLASISVIGLLIICLSSACYDRESGCLDVEATNFNVQVDDACSDCCTYPTLSLSIKHVFGDTVLPFGSDFTLDSIDYFKLIDWRFYISQVKLLTSGTENGVLDTISLVLLDNGVIAKEVVEDNYGIITRNTFTLNIGTIRLSGLIDNIQFSVGLDARSNQTIGDSMSTTHPLGIQTDSMYVDTDNGYLFNTFQFVKDTITGTDTSQLSVIGDANLINFSFPYNQSITKGSNITIDLEVDYKKWLTGIDFVTNSDGEIISKIVGNTPDAISLNE